MSFSCAALGWLWHRAGLVGFFWFLLVVVEEDTELSCVAGLLRWSDAAAEEEEGAGADLRGDRMGATWTQVRLGSELWALRADGLSSAGESVEARLESVEARVESEAAEELRLVLLSSSELTRGDLRSTGDGVGESVPVQLSLRFLTGMCDWSLCLCGGVKPAVSCSESAGDVATLEAAETGDVWI